MAEFHGFDALTGDAQRAGMKGWRPSAFCVVEPVLYRYPQPGSELEFLVCKRLKGALSEANPPACTTSNGGGHHVLVGVDDTPIDAVIRSLNMKLGYMVEREAIRCMGTFGPALNKSNMTIANGEVRLIISDEPAEPEVPFIAHAFAIDASDIEKEGSGNGSLETIGWFSLGDLVENFGASEHHIYFQFLFQFLFLRQQELTPTLELTYPNWRAGTYSLPLERIGSKRPEKYYGESDDGLPR